MIFYLLSVSLVAYFILNYLSQKLEMPYGVLAVRAFRRFALISCLVAGFYACFHSYFLILASSQNAFGHGLFYIENAAARLSWFSGLFLKSYLLLGITALLLAIGILGPFLLQNRAIKRYFVAPVGVLSTINLFLVLFSSLTFFGVGTLFSTDYLQLKFTEKRDQLTRGVEEVEVEAADLLQAVVTEALYLSLLEEGFDDDVAEVLQVPSLNIVNVEVLNLDWHFGPWPSSGGTQGPLPDLPLTGLERESLYRLSQIAWPNTPGLRHQVSEIGDLVDRELSRGRSQELNLLPELGEKSLQELQQLAERLRAEPRRTVRANNLSPVETLVEFTARTLAGDLSTEVTNQALRIGGETGLKDYIGVLISSVLQEPVGEIGSELARDFTRDLNRLNFNVSIANLKQRAGQQFRAFAGRTSGIGLRNRLRESLQPVRQQQELELRHFERHSVDFENLVGEILARQEEDLRRAERQRVAEEARQVRLAEQERLAQIERRASHERAYNQLMRDLGLEYLFLSQSGPLFGDGFRIGSSFMHEREIINRAERMLNYRGRPRQVGEASIRNSTYGILELIGVIESKYSYTWRSSSFHDYNTVEVLGREYRLAPNHSNRMALLAQHYPALDLSVEIRPAISELLRGSVYTTRHEGTETIRRRNQEIARETMRTRPRPGGRAIGRGRERVQEMGQRYIEGRRAEASQLP